MDAISTPSIQIAPYYIAGIDYIAVYVNILSHQK